MVNIDALLSEWAYRCKKGYPDMDSPSDLKVLKSILKEQGIGASLHYPLPVHLHKSYANRIPGNNDLGVTENFYQKHLTLPMFPELENEQVDQIIKYIQSWFNSLE